MSKSALTTQAPVAAVVTTVPPIPGVETPKPGSRFLNRITGADPPAAQPGSAAPKLERMRNIGKPLVRNRLVDPEPATTTTTTAAPALVETTTTTAAPAPAPAKTTKEKPPRQPAKGYNNVPATSGDVTKLTKAVTDLTKKVAAPAAAPAAAPVTLTPSQKKNIDILAQMEETNPERYKGIAQRAQELIPKVAQFEQEYRTKNPDAEEDDIIEAVEEFERKNGVDYDQDDFDDARFDMRTKPLREKMREQEETITRLNSDRDTQNLMPVVAESAVNAGTKLSKAFEVEGLDGVIGDDGMIIPEAAEQLINEAKDPVTAEIAIEAIGSAAQFAEAVMLRFNGHQSQLASHVSAFCKKLESQFGALDPAETRDEHGRVFMPLAQFNKLSAEEQQDYWVISPDLVIDFANDEIKAQALADVEKRKAKIMRQAERLGMKPHVESKSTTAAPTPKPTSPTAEGGAPRPAPAPAGTGGPSKSFIDKMKRGTTSTMLGGRSVIPGR